MTTHLLSYLLIRTITFPIRWLPYSTIHSLGNVLGTCFYHLYPKLRKRAHSNLALAKDLALTPQEIESYAKQSIQNLVITCLEYPKLSQEKHISKVATCLTPQLPMPILNQDKGVIFFCGHQANWEILFLEGTSRMPGTAIGRPVKNHYLYKWITAMREKFGGQMIAPKNAYKESVRALKKGRFVGIVGDQGMPDSGFSSEFFGRQAWTSPLPALLAYRTKSPISVATTKRIKGAYEVTYSELIFPNCDVSSDIEIPRLMEKCLSILQTKIKEEIGQWLWTHNRFKQQLPGRLKKQFRHDAIAVLLPSDANQLTKILPHLSSFKTCYPQELLTFFLPQKNKADSIDCKDLEISTYTSLSDLMQKSYPYKVVYDFIGSPTLKNHFLKQSAFGVYTMDDLIESSGLTSAASLSEIIETALFCHAL
jgi:KDO2-lipid IV(A) lauroyltransferase